MGGTKPNFKVKKELHGLELPKGTVLEIEILNELLGEVSYLHFIANLCSIMLIYIGQWSTQADCCLYFGCHCYLW